MSLPPAWNSDDRRPEGLDLRHLFGEYLARRVAADSGVLQLDFAAVGAATARREARGTAPVCSSGAPTPCVNESPSARYRTLPSAGAAARIQPRCLPGCPRGAAAGLDVDRAEDRSALTAAAPPVRPAAQADHE